MASATPSRVALALLLLVMAACSSPQPEPVPSPEVFGNYRAADGRLIGIDRFVTDDGQATALYAEYGSRTVRRMFEVSEDTYEVGAGFAQQTPAELQVRVRRDANRNITALEFQPAGGDSLRAERVPLHEREVRIPNGEVALAGTLIVPAGRGPHPAIVLLHGSGPLTRHSFGPYPHFFSALGFAVLVYDKRGTGDSQGELFDSSTGILAGLPEERFPERLASDAQAAIRFLRDDPRIDAGQIGLWGSSEGGILAAHVAAADPGIAFIIDSSGAMAPLWETRLFQAGLSLRDRGFTEEQIQQVKRATRQWQHTARTGEGFTEMMAVRKRALDEGKGWVVGWTPLTANTLEQIQWHWNHVAAYDPRQALERIRCPVLGLFGALDTSTDAVTSAGNMLATLKHAGHPDYTVKVIPGAAHSLMEASGGAFMAAGVLDTLESWLKERVKFPVDTLERPQQP